MCVLMRNKRPFRVTSRVSAASCVSEAKLRREERDRRGAALAGFEETWGEIGGCTGSAWRERERKRISNDSRDRGRDREKDAKERETERIGKRQIEIEREGHERARDGSQHASNLVFATKHAGVPLDVPLACIFPLFSLSVCGEQAGRTSCWRNWIVSLPSASAAVCRTLSPGRVMSGQNTTTPSG